MSRLLRPGRSFGCAPRCCAPAQLALHGAWSIERTRGADEMTGRRGPDHKRFASLRQPQNSASPRLTVLALTRSSSLLNSRQRASRGNSMAPFGSAASSDSQSNGASLRAPTRACSASEISGARSRRPAIQRHWRAPKILAPPSRARPVRPPTALLRRARGASGIRSAEISRFAGGYECSGCALSRSACAIELVRA